MYYIILRNDSKFAIYKDLEGKTAWHTYNTMSELIDDIQRFDILGTITDAAYYPVLNYIKHANGSILLKTESISEIANLRQLHPELFI
ncbi:MAG: hypothetical protein BV456_04820 [Thermoplasmata archaeon M8B2D]|nr:MAG: hypothetical protein BV456_04820 [Thermoplasmata archaeon M8B2D]